MNSEIPKWIKEVADDKGLHVKLLPLDQSICIQNSLKAKFVCGEPRAWWMSLSHEARTIQTYNPANLANHLPSAVERCWFLAETEEETIPVYEIVTSDLSALISDCPFFEYYLAPFDEQWLVMESDHNLLYVVEMNPRAQ